MKRTATVPNTADQLATIARYLPSNYTAKIVGDDVLITGEDSAGWTLDGYVIPRLASGLYFAEEIIGDSCEICGQVLLDGDKVTIVTEATIFNDGEYDHSNTWRYHSNHVSVEGIWDL